MRLSTLFLAAAALCFAVHPIHADNKGVVNTSGSVFAAQSIAASGKVTAVIEIGKSSVQAFGWKFTTTGAVNVAAVCTYSDSHLTTASTAWETGYSIAGGTVTNSFTITATPRRSALALPGSNWMKIELTNSDVTPTYLDHFSLFKQ